MSGVICGVCFDATNEPRAPLCNRADCPGRKRSFVPLGLPKREKPCGDCIDGYCTMNCGPRATEE